MSEEVNQLINAAVFVNKKRTFRNVDVRWTDDTVQVYSRSANKPLIQEYAVHELASTRKDSMAWDVKDATGATFRLVTQVGCGCSGIKSYVNNDTYTGTIQP